MAMRREIALRTGPYDPYLGPGASMNASEEGDFIYRAQQAGARVLHEPEVQLIHLAWRTREEWTRVLFCYGTGDAAFAMKHLRCRDLRLFLPFVRRVCQMFARLCFRVLKRVGHQEEHYLRGCWNGVALSWRHPVNRQTKLYGQPKSV